MPLELGPHLRASVRARHAAGSDNHIQLQPPATICYQERGTLPEHALKSRAVPHVPPDHGRCGRCAAAGGVGMGGDRVAGAQAAKQRKSGTRIRPWHTKPSGFVPRSCSQQHQRVSMRPPGRAHC